MIQLAEIPNTYEAPMGVATWIASAAFLLMFWNGIRKAIDREKGKTPQPPNESLELNQKALEQRVGLVEGAVTGVRAELKHDRDNAEHTARVRSAGIYTAINKVRDDLTAKMDAERTEVLDKIQSVDDAVGQYAKDTERALGRIEGKLEH